MMLFVMVFLPMAAALLYYPLCRRSEKSGSRLVLGTTVLVFLLALALVCIGIITVNLVPHGRGQAE